MALRDRSCISLQLTPLFLITPLPLPLLPLPLLPLPPLPLPHLPTIASPEPVRLRRLFALNSAATSSLSLFSHKAVVSFTGHGPVRRRTAVHLPPLFTPQHCSISQYFPAGCPRRPRVTSNYWPPVFCVAFCVVVVSFASARWLVRARMELDVNLRVEQGPPTRAASLTWSTQRSSVRGGCLALRSPHDTPDHSGGAANAGAGADAETLFDLGTCARTSGSQPLHGPPAARPLYTVAPFCTDVLAPVHAAASCTAIWDISRRRPVLTCEISRR